MAFVEISNLVVKYKKFEAVKNLSFNIPKGEVFGFIGPNGAGKTTTIKVLATLLKPDSGTATISGKDVCRNADAVRRLIGYMPDFFGVYEDLNVFEYLDFFATTYGIPFKKRKSVIANVLELTDLTYKQTDSVDGLSRGMKQRLSIARVLIHDPDLLLLDEPASGLDPRARIEMRELLIALKDMGKTILISSHILSELSHLCTRIGIIEAGVLVAEGSVDKVLKRVDLHRKVHVQISDMAEDIPEKIGAIKGVVKIDILSERISVEINENIISVEDLLDSIRSTGARIRMYQPDALDIETAFMKLTEGKLA